MQPAEQLARAMRAHLERKLKCTVRLGGPYRCGEPATHVITASPNIELLRCEAHARLDHRSQLWPGTGSAAAKSSGRQSAGRGAATPAKSSRRSQKELAR